MKSIAPIELTNEEAIVLQQISESGEEDIVSLSSGLRMSRHSVVQHLSRLKRKGLITVKALYGDWWVSTSAKGAYVVHFMWPETAMATQRRVY